MILQAGVDATLLPMGTALATAVVGAFVAYQALRGYRRNASRVMLALAVGIVLLTTAPVAVRLGLELLGLLDGVGRALVAQTIRIAGLVAVLYAFAA